MYPISLKNNPHFQKENKKEKTIKTLFIEN